ncbi:NADP-dependent oxidoreductase [Enterococcus dongliensis]|uniref:NADP-dependent oxidoreductase n=1 Tax=Enterococcus dongliensis TaxID=2559925 RepID=UPI00288C9523|nr:NADP-dependent oxidoreductase [Enterococcus dongliensis]MDT2668594.1 NADP-dependent oxidoreductase [Enterococcus dongliensis]
MKAALIREYGQKKLELAEIAAPSIQKNDVLVKVAAASINPIDSKIKSGKMKLLLKYQMPLILGNDFSGTVVEVGAKVTDYKIGDEVYGRVQKERIGTFAEYLAVAQEDIALMPQNLNFEEAAAIPLVGLTSYQALYEIMELTAKDKVLIQAGSGGIGTIAIQLAKLTGAYVATTTSQKNTALVKELGADCVIDYHKENFDEVLFDYDYVFDTMGGDILEKAFKIVKPNGKVVTLSGIPNKQFAEAYGLSYWKQQLLALASHKLSKLAKKAQVSYHFLFMRPDGKQLAKLTDLIEAGKIHPIIDRVLPLEAIQKAFDYSDSGRARGKIIIKISDE